jgi:hypothetical protein
MIEWTGAMGVMGTGVKEAGNDFERTSRSYYGY